MNRVSFIIAFFFSVTLIFLFSGCGDAEINPYETDTGIYSVYGAINLHETEHVIRVRDLNVFHQDSSSINLDAEVTFYDLENGTSQSLKDSIVQFPANYTHNFILNKELEPRRSYRISVERSDGASVSSIFTTPGITEPYISPTNERFGISCFRELTFYFRNVIPGEQIRWEVGFTYNDDTFWHELTQICPASYYSDSNEYIVKVSTRNLLSTVFPKPYNNASCSSTDPRVTCADLSSDIVSIRYLHLGTDWKRVYPVRHPDPVQIGDVENGLGFLGAYRRETLSYRIYQE